MFNKYWREFPWFFQLFQFILLIFICITFFGVLINYVAPALLGVTLADVGNITKDSIEKIRVAAFIYNGASSLVAFIIPCLLFAFATHPKPAQYLGFRKPTNNSQWIIVLVLSLAAIPTVSGIAGLFDRMPLPANLQSMKESFNMKQNALMNLRTPAEFATALIFGAVVAPIGEELLFRGIMMKFAAKTIKGSVLMPILISGTFFALIHGNVVGIISLIISGVTLGYIYYLTGSLWLSIFSHAVVNATQLCLLYFGRNNTGLKEIVESNDLPWGIFIGGVLVFITSFYWLWKNRTPLPANWASDFTEEELEERKQQNKLF